MLLERDAELAALRTAVDDPSTAAVVVRGGPGLGKTVLLREAERLAGEAGMQVLTARGTELESSYAFGGIRQIFERILDTRPDLRDEPAVAPGLAALDARTPEPGPGDFAVLHGLYRLTELLARTAPVALVIDDLQSLDLPTLRFLTYLLPRLRDFPAVGIWSTRPASGPVREAITELLGDPACRVLTPAPLTLSAAREVIAPHLALPADAAFVEACHTAAEGNPFLLSELARVAAAAQVPPTASHAHRIAGLGAEAVRHRISLWFGRLSTATVSVAQAVAVLGGDATLRHVGTLAGLRLEVVAQAVDALREADLMAVSPATASGAVGDIFLDFVHPLVREAIYEDMGIVRRIDAHRDAVALLRAAGAPLEHAASHLLLIPPEHSTAHAQVLWSAAEEAMRRGAPAAALGYLRRCRQEDAPDQDEQRLLTTMLAAAELVDGDATVECVDALLTKVHDPLERAALMVKAGNALHGLGRAEALTAMAERAAYELPSTPEAEPVRQFMDACVVAATLLGLRQSPKVRSILARWEQDPPHEGWAGAVVDGVWAGMELHACSPVAVELARRVLKGNDLLEGSLASAWFALILADDESVMVSMEAALRDTRRRGASRGLAAVLCSRALARLRVGRLSQAHADAQEAARAALACRHHLLHMLALHVQAEASLEEGRQDEARHLLAGSVAARANEAPLSIFTAPLKGTYCRLLAVRGAFDEAAEAWQELGWTYRNEAIGGRNPAFLPWRSAAAESLTAVGRVAEAERLAQSEVADARAWRGPGALGRALRALAQARPRQQGLACLEESHAVLSRSPAVLERAKTELAWGSALRQSGQRREARRMLTQALDTAVRSGALPLAETARRELRAAGGRPAPIGARGIETLTPSELRTAELASSGLSNREIADRLFVTPKTVEGHLAAAYRKLETDRRGLIANRAALFGSR
ncbi:AAA family ATPase [Streptomyces antibioticus]|uniref:helix-turn-helix transcriptional regulator n=1 Tax=Streptomyces antibioticus TaxID=1890 RepID=UPI0033D2EFA9